MVDMTDDELAVKFRALGDATRMKIFRSLMSGTLDGDASGRGPTASQVCSDVSGQPKINSKVSQHLKVLRHAGLVAVERRGRYMVYRPKTEGLREMLNFLLDVV
jgi:DNA-binding transcriptional ArsR family regulator